MEKKAYKITQKIFDLYYKHGKKDYIGEEVNQEEHMLQAAQLAEENNHGIEVILASLFHDIGHLISFENKDLERNKYGTKDHEKIAAMFLKQNGFEYSIVPDLVQNHVKAKKYLAFKNPDYINKLTHASQMTLIEQGGIMSKEEAEEFEKDSLFKLSIKIREFDEAAKVIDYKTKPLKYYQDMCYQYLINLNHKNKK